MSRSGPGRPDRGTRPETQLAWAGYGWLPLVMPVDARSFRTDDARVATTLVAVGGIPDEANPAVEIFASSSAYEPRAPRVVVDFAARTPDTGPWFVRRAARVLRGLALRLRAARAMRALRRRGYVRSALIPWEEEGAFVPALPGWRGRRALSDLVPVRLGLVADVAGEQRRTVLEAVVMAAGAEHGRALEIERVLVRDTSLVVLDRSSVLRVDFGPAGSGVSRQLAALARLDQLALPPHIRSRASRILADGRCGLGSWSLEDRFSGAVPAAGDDAVTAHCVEFLLGLAEAGRHRVSAELIESEADAVASTCDADLADRVRCLARAVLVRTEALPAVLAHGDFFHGNLLVESGRLSGVVDWERSTLGRPVLHDLAHLLIAARAARDGCSYGHAVVALSQTPAVASTPWFREYCGSLGVAPDDSVVVAVAIGCWLAHVAHQLGRVADNAADPRWVAENVVAPARALATAD